MLATASATATIVTDAPKTSEYLLTYVSKPLEIIIGRIETGICDDYGV